MLDGKYETPFSVTKNNTIISAVNKDKAVFDYTRGSTISASNVYLIGLTFTSNNNVALTIENPRNILISNINIIDCTFKDCKQTAISGAALSIRGGDSSTKEMLITDINVIGSRFYNNSGQHDGPAIYGICVDDIEIVNCEFKNNYGLEDHNSYCDGGAVNIDFSNMVTVINSTFINNSAVEEQGGALWVESKGFVCKGCTFINNTANACGALYTGYDSTDYKPITTDYKYLIDECIFIGNKAIYTPYGEDPAYGGAVFVEDYCIISNCLFKDNSASGENGPMGGAIFLDKHEYGQFTDDVESVINCTFINNSAKTGGAIYIWAANTITDNCTFINNSASNSGGGINVYKQGTNAKIINSKFIENYGKYGGGIRLQAVDDATIEQCTFENNSAEYGGGVYTQGIGASVLDSEFSENTAVYSGGGIYLSGLNTLVDGCEFVSNSVTKDGRTGGAITTSSEYSTIQNSKFTNNSASWGGAIEYTNDDGIIANCEFVENKANGAGGAIDFDGIGTVANSTFVNNEAPERSTVYNSGELNLDKNTIETEFTEIYNDGMIVSPTTLTVLDNKTVDALINENKTITSILVDDNDNRIVSGNLTHTIEGEISNPDFDEYGVYRSYYTPTKTGIIPVYGNYGNATKLTVKNGRLRILQDVIPAYINVTAEDIVEGEVAKINISFVSDEVVGNLTVIVGDQEFEIELTGNYTGILEVPGLKPGSYNVTVIYKGDAYHTPAENSTTFNVLPLAEDIMPNVNEDGLGQEASDDKKTEETEAAEKAEDTKEKANLQKNSKSLKTGNPLLALLAVLFAIPLINRKR